MTRDEIVERLREALRELLLHAGIADAAQEDIDIEDHMRESNARKALALTTAPSELRVSEEANERTKFDAARGNRLLPLAFAAVQVWDKVPYDVRWKQFKDVTVALYAICDADQDFLHAVHTGQKVPRSLSELKALQSLSAPTEEWRPTHRHADGGEYRKREDCQIKDEQSGQWISGVIYDDAHGHVFVTRITRWHKRFDLILTPPTAGET